MHAFHHLLLRSPLFTGFTQEELDRLLPCLRAQVSSYAENSVLLLAGEPVTVLGIVLEGGVQVVREDYSGARTLMAEFSPGELFAEAYACARTARLPVTAISAAQSKVLWLESAAVMRLCSNACSHHAKLIENLIAVLAQKSILLSGRIGHLSRRTTRDKLLAYFYDLSSRQGGKKILLPFNRQQLADYLCVERSAMSAELSRMRQEGLLAADGRQVELLVKKD